ncbi:MAG: amidohydrolase [Chlamydiia bacterium]|nr:amidohydrolase [Chlamydiia bacterium]
MYPEIGFEVHRTADLVSKKLASYGLDVKTNIGKTGVVADLISSGAKKRIALRADMDALPIQEINTHSYASRIPNQAHLCGHDAHTAMLLGAAKILSSISETLNANVRFIFQPCEEMWPPGAQAMIADNVLEGVDEIYALHVWPTLPVGKFGICMGPAMAQADGFEIEIIGKGGHAATPHTAIDPIVIATQVIQSLQTIVSRNIDSNHSAVLTVTQIHAGSNFSVVPDQCKISGTVRTYEPEIQRFICRRMKEVVEGIADSHGAKGVLKYLEGSPPVYNHYESTMKAKNLALDLVGENSIDFPAQKMMFGEDFSYYTNEVNGCFIHLGCRNEEKGIVHLLHDPHFDIDEECLIYGAAMHVELALNT